MNMNLNILVPVALLCYCMPVSAAEWGSDWVVEGFWSQLNQASVQGACPLGTRDNPASSCLEIFDQNTASPSRYYWITGSNNAVTQVYCDFSKVCNGVPGPWTKVASVDMSKQSQCPPGLDKIVASGLTLCTTNQYGLGCSPTTFSVNGVTYSKVCGKITGYRYRTVDAFFRYLSGQTTPGTNYVDGISVTHGNPRKHIWTFAAGNKFQAHIPKFFCPCASPGSTGTTPPPSFVGNDYFCDTASSDTDPLWNGAGCTGSETCCTLHNPPWFVKTLDQSTTDNIDVRLCKDQARNDEDVRVQTIDIYVQ